MLIAISCKETTGTATKCRCIGNRKVEANDGTGKTTVGQWATAVCRGLWNKTVPNREKTWTGVDWITHNTWQEFESKSMKKIHITCYNSSYILHTVYYKIQFIDAKYTLLPTATCWYLLVNCDCTV